MLSLLNVLAAKKNLNAVLKGAVFFAFFSFFSFGVFGQCNNLNVSVGSDIEACNGANITLTATYTGGPSSGTPIYQWSFNDNGGGGGSVDIPGATSYTYTIPNFNNSTDGTYSCTVTFPDVNNCDDSDNVNVNFPNNNFDVNAGNDFSICQGSNATINTTLSNAPGGGNVTYAWNSVPIIPGTYPNQANPTFSGLPTGTYNFAVSATATDNGNTYLGCDIVQVIVNNLNLNAGNDQTICQGSPFTITSSISNNPSTPAVNYSWTAVNTTTGSSVALIQTGSPSNPTFNNLPAGTYTFTGTATVSGCTDTDQIQVIVNPNPTTPTFTIPANGCPGVSIPISGFTPLANTTYSWYPNVGAFINGSTSNPSVTFNNGGNYNVYVTATNSNGCSSNSAIQNVAITNLQVLNPFVEFGTAALTANNYNNITTYTICSGVSGSSAAYIYNTFPNGSSATYSYSYGTQPSSPIFPGIAEEIGLSIGNNYFTITGALNGCVVSETFNIYAGSNPYVAGGVSNSVGLCTGQTVNFAISPVNPTTNSPNAAGTTYTIGVSDVSSSLPGAVNSMPYATYTDLIGNQNVSYTFNSSSCGQNPPGYPANTFYAVIQASNACGTTTSTVSPIVVSALPNSNFNVSATTICVNSSVTITNAGTSGNAITGPNNNAPFSCLNTGGFFYTISPTTGWTVSGGSIGAPGIPVNNWNGITAASNPATVSFNTSGTYIITQKYQNGCGISTSQRTICVVAPPTCAFTVNPTSSCTPLVTNVTNNTTGPSCGTTPLALAYNWTVTNPVGGTSSVATATAVNPTITLNNNTVAPNLAALNFPITLVVNPLIPGTSTPVPNCSSTCNQTVTVYPQPSFITQPVQPPTVCLDGTFNSLSVTVSYLGPGLPSYQWYSNTTTTNSGGTIIPGATSSSYTPPGTVVGTIHYYCIITFPSNSFCGTLTTIAVPAIVWPDPIASATPTTQTICVGATVPVPFTGSFIPGTGTASYQWNTVSGTTTAAINGAITSTYTPPVFTTTGSFNYSVTINTSGSGCTASTSAPIEVIVIPDPTITTQPIGNIYCQNTAAVNITSLSVVATGGSGTFSYQWFVNTTNSNTGGTAISGATSASFSPPSSTVGTFYYYCEISQPVTNCSVTSNPAEIIIVASPTFNAQPLNAQTLCNGGTTTPLSVVTAGGTGTITYQWYSNIAATNSGGTIIPGAISNSYTPPNTNATLPNTTYYYCIVSYSAGGCSSITSNISTINIYPPLIISTQPLNAETICVGGTSSNLAVSILAGTGTGNYSYQWFSNSSAINSGGTEINGATSSTLPSQVFNNVGAYYFYCLITDSGNGCGSIASAVATVTVVNDPTISVQPLPTQSICQNAAPIVLEITANGGDGALQYQWYSNTSNSNSGGIAIIGATSPNYTPSSINIGTYYYYCVITTPTSGCSVSSAVSSVIVISGPTFTTQPLSSVVCQGGSVQQMCVTFINGTGTPQYQWYSNSSASTSGGVPIPNANSNCYTPASNIVGTTYYYCLINLIGGGCSSIISSISSVIVNPIPVAQPIADLTFCNQGQTSVVVLNSNEQNTTFQWSISNPSIGVPMQNGTSNSIPSFIATNSSTSIISSQVNYTPVYTSNGVSCSGTNSSFNIFVNPTPLMSLFNPELFVFCEASQGFVAFSSNIPSNISYNYTNDNNLIGVPLSGTISSPSNGLSFLAVNNSNQPLTSNFLVSPVFTNNNQACPGNTVYFAITVNPLPDIIPVSSQTVCATETASNLYSSINPIIGPGTNYVWTNTNPAIGMASTGVGSNYFTSTNTTLFPISGTISVAPTYTNNGVTCQGSSISFDLIVNPMPTINPISNQTLCLGDLTTTIDPSGPIPNTIFNWTNNSNSIGLGASGAGIINSFLGLNSTNQANSATISYTPTYTNNNVTCSGQSIQVGIVVNPVPILQSISNIEICAQSNVSVPFLTTNNISNTVFQWTNSNSQIGLPLNGEGSISFYAQNSTSSPISATISVTALYVQSGDTCVGSIEVFTIVILPTPTINPISNQTICANNLSNAISFQANYSGVIFNWSNTNSNIGLGTSGNGNIAPFTGTNNGTNPIQGLLTVTPSLTTNSQVCSGTPVNATVTINPLPLINTIPNTTYCEGEFINVVFSSNISSNVTYDWTNSNSSNGIGSSGNGNINFTGSNNNLVNETSSFEVTPIFSFNGVYCPGISTTFNIEIIPTPTINPLSDITLCNGSPVDEILFSSPYTTADFNWTNSIPTIGIAATGVGNIPDFNAINNSTTNPIVSSVFVTPFISQSNLTCAGIPENFNITILPSTTINPISNQLYCNQEFTQFIPITGTGNSFSWSNDNMNIGLGNTGTGGINSFQIINNSNQIDQSNITAYSGYTLNGVSCPGNTTAFSISVLPTPTSNVTSDITICNGITVPEIIFSGNATTFNWLNSNSNIGLPNSGSGNIASFVATNYTPNANASIVTYTPVITSNNFSCFGASNSFTINVQASPIFVIQPIPTQSACLNGTINTLTVQYSNGNGTPSYQWYSNSNSSYSNGIAIQGATTSSFTPSSLQSGTTYYYCMISFSGAGGCTMINSNIAEVIVVPDPTISLQPLTTQTICVGGTIPLALNVNFTGGVGTPTYQWFSTPASSISGATSNSYTPPVYSTTGTFNYYATISLSGSGCDALTSTNGTVIVVADPTAIISSDASYCQNAGSVLALAVVVSSGQGTPSYQWYSNIVGGNTTGSPIAGATAISYTPPVTATGITYYYCVITQSGANCSVNSPAAQITVTPAPNFTTQPTNTQSVCVGGTTTQLSVAYSNGTGTASYQWYASITSTYAGGTAIPGQTSSTFTPPTITSSTIYYYCIISFSASGGCSMINSNIAEVIVLPDPTISTQPITTQTICVGGTIPAALNVAYTGGVGTPTYQWFSTPASSISGATSNSYTPPVYSTTGTFNYYATISLSGSGCDALTSANTTVIVVADPLVSVQPTATQSVCQNTATLQLSVSITGGNGSASYQWFSNTTNSNIGGTIIAGATLSAFTPPSSVVGIQYYYCVINQTGANCGVTSNPAEVIVNLAPAISSQPLGAQQHCLNAGTNNLQVDYSNGTGLPSYQWFVNTTNSAVGGAQINSATNNMFTPPSSIDGTFYYYCVISFVSGGGCPSITSNASQVIIHPYPIVTITGGETICLLESSDINFAFTPSSGLYDITITANGQSSTLQNYNGANPLYTVTPTLTTTYVITNIAYDQVPQCAIQPNTSIVVIVNPLPALDHSNYTFCSDVASTVLQYFPDANTYSYDWLPNPSANYIGQNNGPSSITVSLPDPLSNSPTNFYYVSNLTNNATGCQALDSILVTINPNPVGIFTLPTTGCINSPIPLSNGNATIGSYEWTIDGLLYSTLANPIPPVFNSLGIHDIEMVASNIYGCTDTLFSSIQIYDQAVSNFIADLNSGCAPLPVNFTNLSTGSYITSYDWTFAPDTVSWNNVFSSTSLIDPPSVTYLQGDITTTYSVTLAVTNACGTVTSSQQITVLPTPVANFTLATHTICSGSTLMVNNISVGEPTGYVWNYGPFTSYNPNLNSMFFPSDSVTNVYPITLTITNACGTDVYNDSITVLPDNVNGGFTTSLDAGCSPLTVTLVNTTFNTNLTAIWHLDDPLNTTISNQNTVQFTYFATNNITQYYNPYLVVTDGCANDTIYANLSVFANPIPNITASQLNICEGSTVDFTGNVIGGGNGFGYIWDFGGLGTAITQNASFNFADGSNVGQNVPVTLTVSSPNNFGANCSNSTSTVIYVYNNPDLSQVTYNTTDGCSQLDVQISNLPNNLNLINWGDGSTNTNVGHTYVNNSNAIQSYNLGISSSVTYPTIPNLVCTSLANQSISVHPSPLPVIASSATQSCEGQMIDFTASTINNQNFGVDFSWNIGNLSTSNTSNTSYNFISGSAAGIAYPIELTASQTTLGLTCSETVNSTVVIYDTPDVTPITFNTNSGCSDLEIIIANLPAANNQINWGDGSINSFNSHTYSNNGPGLLSYPVTVTSSTTYNALPQLTCTATENQLVDVYPTPIPQITSSSQNICEGGNVNFTASTSNNQNSGVSYQWNFGSLGTSNLNATSMLFSNGSNSGTTYPIQLLAYQTVQGVYCSDSVSTTVVVYETPDVTPITFNTNSGCSDLEIIIANLPAANNQINWGDGITNFSISHTYNNTGSGLLNYPITLTSTSTYGIAPQLNCVVTLTQNITVYPTPLPQIFSSAINVCEGGSVDFIASTSNNQNTGITYMWDFGVLGTSSDANTSTTFTTGNATGLQTTVSLTAFQNTSGTICTTTTSEIVNVFDTPDLTAALYSNVNDCSPLLVSISNLPTSTYTYNWGDGTTTSNPNHIYLNQGATPLNYNISIDATTFYPTLPMLSCNAITNQIVQVNPQPFASFSINPSEGCFYNPVTTTLENTSVNAIAPYVWNYDGIAHTTNSLNYIAIFNTPGAHPVELVVTNQFGCTDSTSQDFIIHDLPTVTLNTIDDALCLGATTEFEIDGTGISTSSWDFGDGITLNLLNPTSLVHYYNQPGVYSVTAIVTNIYGCSDTITFPNEVIIYPTPTASFTTNTTIADIVYPYFEFYDNSAGAINYYWNFGDSNWSNDVNPTHTYNTEGNYLVELTVTNEYNCFDIAYQIVQVEGIVVYIPNAFTPLDYNGVNDVFKPTFSSTEGIEFYEMIIYNRWGAKIFQTNSIDEAWIGNSQENDAGDDNYYAQNDTYIYTVRYRKKARAYDPQPDQIITGHVTIIR